MGAVLCYRALQRQLLCQKVENFKQVVSLGSDLSSAKTFYKFHLNGVRRYQDEYEITGSSVYLQVKESSQKQTDGELEKINETTLAMQDIEKRGY